MGKPGLDTVIARREFIKSELAAIDKLRAAVEAEGQDLAVAERVLTRLASLPKEEVAPETP